MIRLVAVFKIAKYQHENTDDDKPQHGILNEIAQSFLPHIIHDNHKTYYNIQIMCELPKIRYIATHNSLIDVIFHSGFYQI